METTRDYTTSEPERADVDIWPGATLLEFGAPWCEHCQAAQALIASALASRPPLRHIKIEDGPGRRLGRSFRVKLWPTLVLLEDGKEIARLVRPENEQAIRDALALIGSC